MELFTESIEILMRKINGSDQPCKNFFKCFSEKILFYLNLFFEIQTPLQNSYLPPLFLIPCHKKDYYCIMKEKTLILLQFWHLPSIVSFFIFNLFLFLFLERLLNLCNLISSFRNWTIYSWIICSWPHCEDLKVCKIF